MDPYAVLVSADEFFLIRKTGAVESGPFFLSEQEAGEYVTNHPGYYFTTEKVAERLLNDGVMLESGETLFLAPGRAE